MAAESGGAPELVVVGSFPGKPSFRGLGELTAAELETLWPERRVADATTLDAASDVWRALRAPEPTQLAEWAARETAGLPFLSQALGRLLEEIPDARTGLSGTERRALQAVADGATTPGAAFLVAQNLEDAPFLGDAWFFRALHGLGPLLTTGDGPLPPAPPLGDGRQFAWLSLRLTPDGERVLRGELDRVDRLGVDRWIGGTHVTPANLWRWDGERAALVHPHG